MTKDEALKLALEALETLERQEFDYKTPADILDCLNAITAIKEALAQPEQTNTRPYYTIDELNAWADEKEKQAWRNAAIRIGEELSSVGPDGYYEMDAWKWLEWAMAQEPRGKNSLAQPEQEPMHPQLKAMLEEYFDKCFAESAPQRTWVGLTDEDIALIDWESLVTKKDLVKAIEAKLKEKNT